MTTYEHPVTTFFFAVADTCCCASCGITGSSDSVKLKKCACQLVKYCSVACQKEHRSKHKKECKKRVAELRDEMLFKQPESSFLGDCPICCLPLPFDLSKSTFMTCCSKVICIGCNFANKKREWEQSLHPSCPFCRTPVPETKAEADKNEMKRVKKNDPVAIRRVGRTRFEKRDYDGAFSHWKRAAQLGDVRAHYELSCLYRLGQGVEKDEKKSIYYLEEAACGGYVDARHNLALHEERNGNIVRAVKHFIIAAHHGDDESLKILRSLYAKGEVSKEDYEAALRAHQAALDATKSSQREAAEEFYKKFYKRKQRE